MLHVILLFSYLAHQQAVISTCPFGLNDAANEPCKPISIQILLFNIRNQFRAHISTKNSSNEWILPELYSTIVKHIEYLSKLKIMIPPNIMKELYWVLNYSIILSLSGEKKLKFTVDGINAILIPVWQQTFSSKTWFKNKIDVILGK